MDTVKRCIGWATTRKGMNVTRNPLASVNVPKVQSRAVVISREEHEGLLALWDDQPMRDLLQAMWATGARPGELAKIEAQHYRNGIWVLEPTEHKTGYVTGKGRRARFARRPGLGSRPRRPGARRCASRSCHGLPRSVTWAG
jgi:integrase